MDNPGFICLVPTLIVFLLAVITRRPIESLISGSLVGLGIIHGTQFIGGFAVVSAILQSIRV
jgi:Na+/H+ antiporter NhaC